MALQVMEAYQAYLGIYDISADFAKVSGEVSCAPIDNTPMNTSGYRSYIASIPEANVDFDGYWQEGATTIGEILNTYNSSDGVQLICYAGGVPLTGSGGLGFAGMVSGISTIRSEQVGDLARIRFTAKSAGPFVRVVPLYALSTRTSTNNGNAYQLEAVPSGSTLYGFLSVTAASGTGPPTLVVKLQSSPTGTGWTDRITFTSTSTTTTEVKTASGPITDTYWRQYWTITGTNPSFTFTSAWGYK